MTVVLTAAACRTAAGHRVADVLHFLERGQPAFTPGPFPSDVLAVPGVCAIPGAPPPSRHHRFVRRMGAWCLHAAAEVLEAITCPAGHRTGLFLGFGGVHAHWDEVFPALASQEPSLGDAWNRGLRNLHPYWMLNNLSNNVQALAAQQWGITGDGAVHGGEDAGLNALTGAIRALEDGRVDAALVLAHDTLVVPEHVVNLVGRGALAPAGPVVGPYRPASRGAVAGEAAAALVLVRGERGVSVRTHRHPVPVDVVDGLGAGVPAQDLAERLGLAEHVDPGTPMTCFSAALGQLGAASEVVRTALMADALVKGRFPAVAGLTHAADGPLVPLASGASLPARSAWVNARRGGVHLARLEDSSHG